VAQLGLGNGYSIDMADVDRFVKALEDAKAALDGTLNGTAADLRVVAPGHDDYSGAFAFTLQSVVERYKDWNRQKQNDLQSLIDRVKAATASYAHAEHDNTPRV
jgi:hypothetical protein